MTDTARSVAAHARLRRSLAPGASSRAAVEAHITDLPEHEQDKFRPKLDKLVEELAEPDEQVLGLTTVPQYGTSSSSVHSLGPRVLANPALLVATTRAWLVWDRHGRYRAKVREQQWVSDHSLFPYRSLSDGYDPAATLNILDAQRLAQQAPAAAPCVQAKERATGRRPPSRAIHGAADAEVCALEWMHFMGHADAELRHARGRRYVESRHALAQAVADRLPVATPALKQLFEDAEAIGKVPHFFSMCQFTSEALKWGDAVGMFLFTFNPGGHVVGLNRRAVAVLKRLS
ncbi:hypothetical protein [Ornithinimicrobium pratense]|uniref:Uncharacterized protein n=1 Tax=Ornithinimicrobium pratense TaxID=2593973 RepID=A0A5J6V638_9MICO|nr:hypothetical protein [Ornithinimicrobium pratense]QFG69238.1 hypothetical protein FY030_11440 [Ornithinimicrobium pratense]